MNPPLRSELLTLTRLHTLLALILLYPLMHYFVYCHTIPNSPIFFLRFPIALLISQLMVYRRLRFLLRMYPSLPSSQVESVRATIAPFRSLNHYVFMSLANNVMQLCDNCFQGSKATWTLGGCALFQVFLLLRARTLEKQHKQLGEKWSSFYFQTD